MTNTYKKYCPNVFVAVCEKKHNKGDIIIVSTKYGKENECEVHNHVGYFEGKPCYSITRTDGFDSREHARRKAERREQWAQSAEHRSKEWYEKSLEGKDFLSLAEPIKIGHHSERRHRNLINRNWERMGNSVKETRKAQDHRSKISYWEARAGKIDLSMPESLEYFEFCLEQATEKHKGLKDGTIEREHSYSLTYAKKEVNDLKKKVVIAEKLWGESNAIT